MITLEKAATTEMDAIADLARIIWNEHYIPIIGEKQVNYMLERIYSPGSMEQQAVDGQQFFFICDDGKRLGFVSVSLKEQGEELFIHKFYILPQRQQKGLGSQVFQLLADLFKGYRKMRLTVNRQNYKSINFYFKNDFVIEEVADFDIGNGYFMNDFVMVRSEN